MASSRRRSAALSNVVNRRASFGGQAVDFTNLVRVYLLDGSSKVFQMSVESTAEEVICQLKYNLDLEDISTHALFRVMDRSSRRVELSEKIKEVLVDPTDSGQDVRLLFRSWISARCGAFEKLVFQDNTRHKNSNTALWLAFMEASFMCTTGKYYLSEEESIMLGCLKMQAESGDFNPEVHTVENVKFRVASRFPNPARNKMRALMSPTLAGTNMADVLAYRIQHLYARVAGKHKAEAQIDFLQTLRTWCPFYGATFFSVQCQFDDGLSEAEPPVTSVHAAIGPLAIFLITVQEPPMILRHPYKRILKWVAYKDKHIFHYWVIKAHVTLRDIQEAQVKHEEENDGGGEEFNPQIFCDCVYLVLPLCGELEFLVRSYVNLLRDIPPKLKGAKGELVTPKKRRGSVTASGGAGSNGQEEKSEALVDKVPQKPLAKRMGRFERLFRSLGTTEDDGGGNNDPDSPNSTYSSSRRASMSSSRRRKSFSAGSGIDADSEDSDRETYGDDSGGVSKSLFQAIYRSSTTTRRSMAGGDSSGSGSSGDEHEAQIPAQIKFAASMSELQRMAMEERFSDDEDSDSNSSGDESELAPGRSKLGRGKAAALAGGKSSTAPEVPSEGAFARVSRILFGTATSPPQRQQKEGDSDSSSEEEEEDEDDD